MNHSQWAYPLVNIQKAIEDGPVEIVDFPARKCWIFPSFFVNSLPDGNDLVYPKEKRWGLCDPPGPFHGHVTGVDHWMSLYHSYPEIACGKKSHRKLRSSHHNPFKYYIISYHIISCHLISYHIISYHIILYYIIYIVKVMMGLSKSLLYYDYTMIARSSHHNPPPRNPNHHCHYHRCPWLKRSGFHPTKNVKFYKHP